MYGFGAMSVKGNLQSQQFGDVKCQNDDFAYTLGSGSKRI